MWTRGALTSPWLYIFGSYRFPLTTRYHASCLTHLFTSSHPPCARARKMFTLSHSRPNMIPRAPESKKFSIFPARTFLSALRLTDSPPGAFLSRSLCQPLTSTTSSQSFSRYFPMYTRRDDVARICTARPKGSLGNLSLALSGTPGNSSMVTTQARGHGSTGSSRYSLRSIAFRSAPEQRHL